MYYKLSLDSDIIRICLIVWISASGDLSNGIAANFWQFFWIFNRYKIKINTAATSKSIQCNIAINYQFYSIQSPLSFEFFFSAHFLTRFEIETWNIMFNAWDVDNFLSMHASRCKLSLMDKSWHTSSFSELFDFWQRLSRLWPTTHISCLQKRARKHALLYISGVDTNEQMLLRVFNSKRSEWDFHRFIANLWNLKLRHCGLCLSGFSHYSSISTRIYYLSFIFNGITEPIFCLIVRKCCRTNNNNQTVWHMIPTNTMCE